MTTDRAIGSIYISFGATEYGRILMVINKSDKPFQRKIALKVFHANSRRLLLKRFSFIIQFVDIIEKIKQV